jgi:hypothetical protein
MENILYEERDTLTPTQSFQWADNNARGDVIQRFPSYRRDC